jgi:tRNA A-37 threonylcarbamoyl transferase component Bud32
METTSLSNTRLGPYVLGEAIGRGGAATVYRAHQPSLGRDVAIKVLRHDADPQFARRFAREARAIAALQHPNILPVYDFGEHDGLQYLVMRYVPGGRTLREALADGPLDLSAALHLMARLLDALAYAHAQGVVHRDIKPGNVLLPSPDWPLLADFGIARLGGDTQQLTLAGQAIGTPDYMSPEQATGRPTDARSDIYSAGVMLYEMLTGRAPFRGEGALAVVAQHVNQPPPPPRLFAPQLPAAVEAALLRALAKDPAERYQSAREMAEALAAANVQRSTLNVQQTAAPALERPLRVRPVLFVVGLLLAAVVVWLALGRGGVAGTADGRLPVLLEDTAWEGGYRRTGAATVYGGRTATWVYGTTTQYSAMRATFVLDEAPGCAAALRVEGMDSEGQAKTPISVAVNGAEIYRGPNPLPDDDLPLETGTWAAHTFTFDGSLLRAGHNEVRIANLAEGAFSLPPFFMLDYAEVRCAR